MYAALNGIYVFAADTRNSYLQAPSSHKEFIICGTYFGFEYFGKKALTRRAPYLGKADGSDFKNHLRDCMINLNFESFPADSDVWMIPAMKYDG